MDRVALALGALCVGAAVALGLPSALALASTWRPEHTHIVVGTVAVCAVLLFASPAIMAWRGTWPGRQRDADTIKMIDGSLKLAQRALPMAEKQDATRAWWDAPATIYDDVTTGRVDNG